MTSKLFPGRNRVAQHEVKAPSGFLWPLCLDSLCFLVRTPSPTFHFAFPGWSLAARHGTGVWHCSSPAGCSFALPPVLPWSAPQRTVAVLDPATICPALSYPQIAKPSKASGITLPTTPCASTPLSTQSHTSSTSLGSFRSCALNSPCFPPLSPCHLLSACPIPALGHFLLHLLCLDMCLGPYQHWNPFPLLQPPLKNRRLVSLARVTHLLFFIFWLLLLSQLGTPLW